MNVKLGLKIGVLEGKRLGQRTEQVRGSVEIRVVDELEEKTVMSWTTDASEDITRFPLWDHYHSFVIRDTEMIEIYCWNEGEEGSKELIGSHVIADQFIDSLEEGKGVDNWFELEDDSGNQTGLVLLSFTEFFPEESSGSESSESESEGHSNTPSTKHSSHHSSSKSRSKRRKKPKSSKAIEELELKEEAYLLKRVEVTKNIKDDIGVDKVVKYSDKISPYTIVPTKNYSLEPKCGEKTSKSKARSSKEPSRHRHHKHREKGPIQPPVQIKEEAKKYVYSKEDVNADGKKVKRKKYVYVNATDEEIAMDQNRIRRQRRKERGSGKGEEDLSTDGKVHRKKRALLPGQHSFDPLPQRSHHQKQQEAALDREIREKKERKEARARKVEERMWQNHQKQQLRSEQLQREEQERIARLEQQAGLRKLYKVSN